MNTTYHTRKRREKRSISEFEDGDLQIALHHFNGCCAYCGVELNTENRKTDNGLELDHFYSLSAQDSYGDEYDVLEGFTLANTLPTCRRCNRRKKDSAPETWLAKQFGENKKREILYNIEYYFALVTGDD